MSPRALQHAFDPFFSEQPAGRRTGLGLTRARRLIEFLWAHFLRDPSELEASEYTRREDALTRRIADYISGMTDGFAIAAAGRLGFTG